MPATPTYNPVPHVPATARTQLATTRRLREPRAASVSYRASVPAGHAGCGVALSYRASSPDGEIWSFPIEGNPSVTPTNVHCTLFIVHSYTFSAKERDSETGLSCFGSRYYSSDLSIWLSVDPMSDKYAYQSGYVYCGNNPIKLFDPNGEDEWEVNESGYIRRIHNDKPDRIYAVSGTQKGEWGERKSDVKPLDVDKSVMSTIDTKNGNTTFYVMNKRKEMNNLFEFLADNTNVEWTQISTHDFMEDKYDLLTSSHDYTETVLTTRQKALITNAVSQGLLDVFKHSHPNKYMGDDYMIKTIYSFTCNIPSSSDFTTKDALFKENALSRKQPLFFLRNGGEYYEY